MKRRCFICGEDNPTVMERHHIIPQRYGGSGDNENLVDLCSNCHTAIEKLYGDQFYDQLISQIESHELGNSDVEDGVRQFAEFEIDADDYYIPSQRYAERRGEIYQSYKEFCEQRRIPCHTSQRRFFADLKKLADANIYEKV